MYDDQITTHMYSGDTVDTDKYIVSGMRPRPLHSSEWGGRMRIPIFSGKGGMFLAGVSGKDFPRKSGKGGVFCNCQW